MGPYRKSRLVFLRRGACVRGFYLCALVALFLQFAGGASVAGVIYEYREEGGPEEAAPAIGTIEIKSPPASASGAWGTVDVSDLLALFLDDAVFGLGSGNVLAMGGTLAFSGMTSFDGATLDGGSLGITFPTVPPSDPGGPTIDRSLTFTFDVLPGEDFIGMATTETFPDGTVIIRDLFLFGGWVARAAVPEPSTLALLGIGLSGVSWIGYRRRSRPISPGNRTIHRLDPEAAGDDGAGRRIANINALRRRSPRPWPPSP